MCARPYHHGDLRAALLTSAEQALREKGAAELTLRELAREVGVSHTAPRRHFRDMNALLDALAVTGYERLARVAAEADDPSLPFAQRLVAHGRAYLRFAADNGALLELMLARKHAPEAEEQLLPTLERTIASLRHMIVEAQERGDLVRDDPHAVMVSAGAALHGLAAFVANGTLAPEPASEALDALVRHLLQGLTPR
ncbi:MULTISPECIES: TetR/AcrR family transcriptional regulator [unclassified Streptomyces]|uniref:TetR/AcrR family transcriptional regulator n=1 Tax=unclassified Streptomyces TaxID=2593676 RepID=UPI0038041979